VWISECAAERNTTGDNNTVVVGEIPDLTNRNQTDYPSAATIAKRTNHKEDEQ
jgi:hypothetical protein